MVKLFNIFSSHPWGLLDRLINPFGEQLLGRFHIAVADYGVASLECVLPMGAVINSSAIAPTRTPMSDATTMIRRTTTESIGFPQRWVR